MGGPSTGSRLAGHRCPFSSPRPDNARLPAFQPFVNLRASPGLVGRAAGRRLGSEESFVTVRRCAAPSRAAFFPAAPAARAADLEKMQNMNVANNRSSSGPREPGRGPSPREARALPPAPGPRNTGTSGVPGLRPRQSPSWTVCGGSGLKFSEMRPAPLLPLRSQISRLLPRWLVIVTL